MRKLIFVLLILLFTACAYPGVNIDNVAVLKEAPPHAKYKVLGTVEESACSVDETSTMVLTQWLQAKAAELGADAIILGKPDRYMVPVEQVANYDADPFKRTYSSAPYVRLRATAIKWQ